MEAERAWCLYIVWFDVRAQAKSEKQIQWFQRIQIQLQIDFNPQWLLNSLYRLRLWERKGWFPTWVSNKLVFKSVPNVFKSGSVTAPLSAPLSYKAFRWDKLLLTNAPFHTTASPFMVFVWRIWKNFCGTSDLWTSFAKHSFRTKGKSCLPCNQSASIWATEKCIQAAFWKKWVSVILPGGFLHRKQTAL